AVVGWRWDFEACTATDSELIAQCTATARNAWSDARGVEPVPGTFLVEVTENGVVGIIDNFDAFGMAWSDQSFGPFVEFVVDNDMDDAETMFGTPGDVTPEILGLYEQYTTAFVEAQQDP
ncbi:MAG: hypothetical protein AAF547_14990, partial [Actinomycetota bacterium]